MKVLGIDPGTATTGWGVVEAHSQKITCCGVGTIVTPPKTDLAERLTTIYDDLTQLIHDYAPDYLAVEELFFNTNAKTALSVGHARGVILLAGYKGNLPTFSYTPLQVKVAVAGYGRAEKEQVQKMIKELLGLSTIPKPDDAADALAVAITHVFSHRMKGK